MVVGSASARGTRGYQSSAPMDGTSPARRAVCLAMSSRKSVGTRSCPGTTTNAACAPWSRADGRHTPTATTTMAATPNATAGWSHSRRIAARRGASAPASTCANAGTVGSSRARSAAKCCRRSSSRAGTSSGVVFMSPLMQAAVAAAEPCHARSVCAQFQLACATRLQPLEWSIPDRTRDATPAAAGATNE